MDHPHSDTQQITADDDLTTAPDEDTETVVINTYIELRPYIEELVRILEKVYELGKSRGEQNLLQDYLLRAFNDSGNEV